MGAISSSVGVLLAIEMSAPPQIAARDHPSSPTRRLGRGVIEGRVFDGQTGNVVPWARVRLVSSDSQRSSVLTDQTGTFIFTALPQGTYSLIVDKATYMPSRYPGTHRTTFRTMASGVAVSDYQVIRDINVSLFHGASI